MWKKRVFSISRITFPGPSPGFSTERAKNQKEGPKTRRGGGIFKYIIGCMQQPGGQTWNGGGTDFKWEGRAPLVPPLATALHVPHFGEIKFCFSSVCSSLLRIKNHQLSCYFQLSNKLWHQQSWLDHCLSTVKIHKRRNWRCSVS